MVVSREHVEQALNDISGRGVPSRRRSTEYCLVTRGLHYPPKYTLALANFYENGHELQADERYGGEATNAELRELGYEVIEHNCRNSGLRDRDSN